MKRREIRSSHSGLQMHHESLSSKATCSRWRAQHKNHSWRRISTIGGSPAGGSPAGGSPATLLPKKRPPQFDLTKTLPTPSIFYRTATSHGLFESLCSQLQNALLFESEAAHLRSRGHGREKVHFFIEAILGRKQDEYRNNFHTIVLRNF